MHGMLWLTMICLGVTSAALAQHEFETDVVSTSAGELTMTFIGHGTLMFSFDGKVIHVDPWSELADYSGLPKADVVLITHEHRDHLDPGAVENVRKPGTMVLLTQACAGRVKNGTVIKNGESKTVQGIAVAAVPAYNVVHKRGNGQPYHPKGAGNGYILTFGDKRVYVAGDTENTPEMKALTGIDIAFLPMNLPYTMTPEMVADAAKTFKPKILYPYHYGDINPDKLVRLLAGTGIEVRVRKLR